MSDRRTPSVACQQPARAKRGFTLIELMIAVVVVAVLMTLAYPSFQRYLIRASREAAQTTLLDLATLQEKVFLNSSAYVGSGGVTGTYTGTSSGGLGLTGGRTPDGKYTIALDSGGTATTFTLRATPVTGSTQASDGDITIDQAGTRRWAAKSW